MSGRPNPEFPIGQIKIIRAPMGRMGPIAFARLKALKRPIVATLGNFDGVHRGHQTLLSKVKELGPQSGGSGIVISFYPHPAIVLGRAQGSDLPSITTLQQKLSILNQFQIDLLCAVHFTKRFAQLSAEDFLQGIVIDGLGIDHLVLGPDAHVGKGGKADTRFIAEYMAQHQRKVSVVEPFELQGERISSRKIRTLISQGDVKRAALQLGRPFCLSGRVVHGNQRGRTIGFPTANLLTRGQSVPARGVYCGFATVDGCRVQAVVNIGQRPTFNRDGTTGELKDLVEVHLLDFSSEIYGSNLDLSFIDRLRDEKRFSGIDALKEQIGKDVESARSILSKL